jgi:hypothetical protein
VSDFDAALELRSFELVGLASVLLWLPWFHVPRAIRFSALWVLLASVGAQLIPASINGWSIWMMTFAHLPGLAAIRDPSRIGPLYDLGAVLVTGSLLSRLPRASGLRIGVVGVALLLLATDWNRTVFSYGRPISVFREWVEAPIAIDPSCRSFFVEGASDRYMSRSGHMWTLYGVDAMFISLNHSIPTLNGYSAWNPADWHLANPQEPEYADDVRRWIAAHDLKDTCALDIEARTMGPYRPTRE